MAPAIAFALSAGKPALAPDFRFTGVALMAPGSLGDGEDLDLVAQLFHTEHSRKVARLFLEWFRSRQGEATKAEVSHFADRLAAGEWDATCGRATFYGYILRPFLNHGLISLEMRYDPMSRKAFKVYRRIIQPTQRRRPPGPSMLYNVHLLAEKWNRAFGE